MRMFTLSFGHDSLVQFRGLGVFGFLALVCVMRFSRDDRVGDGVGGFGGVGTELVSEAVGCVLLVSGVIGVGAHWPVKVERGHGAGHKGTIH